MVGTVRGNVATTRKTTRRDILSLLDNLQERFPDSHKGNVFTEIPHSLAAVYNTTQSAPTAHKVSSILFHLGPFLHSAGLFFIFTLNYFFVNGSRVPVIRLFLLSALFMPIVRSIVITRNFVTVASCYRKTMSK